VSLEQRGLRYNLRWQRHSDVCSLTLRYRRAQASASMYERKGSVLEFPRMRATQVESPQDVARWISTPLLAIGNGAVDTR